MKHIVDMGIQSHMRHILDLVIERLGCPLMFTSKSPKTLECYEKPHYTSLGP